MPNFKTNPTNPEFAQLDTKHTALGGASVKALNEKRIAVCAISLDEAMYDVSDTTTVRL